MQLLLLLFLFCLRIVLAWPSILYSLYIGGNRQLAWQFHTSKSKQRSLSRAWQLQDNEGRSMITNVDVNNNHMGRYTCYDTAKKHDKSQVILRRRRGKYI